MANNHVITYIKNNKYKEEYASDPEAVRWKRGFDMICDGQLLQRKRENRPKNIPHSLNFRCVKLECAGSVTIDITDNTVNHYTGHSLDDRGEPIHPVASPVAFEVREVIANMKKRCRTEDKAPNKIYIEEQAKLSSLSEHSNEALSNHWPSYRHVRPAMVKHQRKREGSVRRRRAKRLEEVNIAGDDLLTIKKDKWIVNVKSGNKIVIGVAPTALKILAQAEQVHADGTFYVAPHLYQQLWIVHAWINGRMIPCCYALMNRRRKRDYDIVIKSKF
jgi:hypothetical protein